MWEQAVKAATLFISNIKEDDIIDQKIKEDDRLILTIYELVTSQTYSLSHSEKNYIFNSY